MNRPKIERRRFPRDPAREWRPWMPWREALGFAMVIGILWLNGLTAL